MYKFDLPEPGLRCTGNVLGSDNSYPPPTVPVLARCTVCRRFFMSNEMPFHDGQWKCRFTPDCEGYGYGLNVFKATHGIFARVGAFGVYRHWYRRS